jgi:hypothetical protein
MTLNRQQILKKLSPITSTLLKGKGYISFVDVLMEMGYLSKEDYESWRSKKIPYLEKVIHVNLNKINFVLRSVQKYCRNGNLNPSKMVYKSWGKGPKKLLRFSKSGDPNIEEAYSTHFIRRNGVT